MEWCKISQLSYQFQKEKSEKTNTLKAIPYLTSFTRQINFPNYLLNFLFVIFSFAAVLPEPTKKRKLGEPQYCHLQTGSGLKIMPSIHLGKPVDPPEDSLPEPEQPRYKVGTACLQVWISTYIVIKTSENIYRYFTKNYNLQMVAEITLPLCLEITTRPSKRIRINPYSHGAPPPPHVVRDTRLSRTFSEHRSLSLGKGCGRGQE